MQQQCILANAKGGSENLQLITLDIPEPALGQVRVKIVAAGVSGADVLMREGVYPVDPPAFPFIPGYDIVGVVEKNGEGAEKFATGQMVAALTKIGGYAEFICLPEEDLVLLPPGVDPVEGVSVILNYITCYQILHRVAEVKAGERILIHGAAGGIGTAMLELGKLAGLEMYGTASKSKHETVIKLGGIPIDYKNENVLQRIYELTGDGVDIVSDPIGGENCFRSYPMIRDGGRVVSFGASFALKQNPPDMQEVFFWWRASLALNLLSESKKVLTYAVSISKKEHHDWYVEDLTTVLNLLAEKKIKPLIALTLPLTETVKAHQLLDGEAVNGKIVLLAQ